MNNEASRTGPHSLAPFPADAVAIVGMGCRLPGGVHGPTALWENLLHRFDGVSSVPADRWKHEMLYSKTKGKPGKYSVTRAAFLTDWDHKTFDREFFGINPREAEQMDPQQRLVLETAVEALNDAGIGVERAAAGSTGVFVGAFMMDQFVTANETLARSRITAQTTIAGNATMIAARISHALNLTGPSLAIDTACSSSLVAFHVAVQSIRTGESDLALTGGVNFMLRPETFITLSAGGFLAADGRSKCFDVGADGYGRGEGCGIVVLKRLEDALGDNDRIYAVVRGTGVNQDGHTSAIAVPSAAAQQALMERVLATSEIDPRWIDYVEAHGTGTPIGDPAECSSIATAYARFRPETAPCYVGSIKSSTGHLEAGAGIAGILKAALVARHRKVPPQGWIETLNPNIDFEKLNLRVPVETTEIGRPERGTFVAVNSFGYGGTNAHVILQSPPASPGASPGERRANAGRFRVAGKDFFALTLSAQSEAGLTAVARQWLEKVEHCDAGALGDLCWSTATRRSHWSRRAMVLGTSLEDIETALDDLAEAHPNDALVTAKSTNVSSRATTGPAFVFSGMGPQWWGMARQLLLADSRFRAVADACDAAFGDVAGWSILQEMLKDEADSQIADTRVAQPANAVVQIGLTELFKTWGIVPQAVIGHSTGEIAAAYAAGIYDIPQAMTVAFHRSQAQGRLSGKGAMLAAGLSENEAGTWVGPDAQNIAIAAINGPNSVTFSGRPATLRYIQTSLEAVGRFVRMLDVDIAYHSPQMAEIREELTANLSAVEPGIPSRPIYSTVTGKPVRDERFDAAYWYRNVRDPVRFRAAIEAMIEDGWTDFVEVGPHPVLSHSIQQIGIAGSTAITVANTLSRRRSDDDSIARALGQIYVNGGTLDWSLILGRGCRVDLPGYPWQRELLWYDRPETEAYLGLDDLPDLLGRRDEVRQAWYCELHLDRFPWLRDHVVDGEMVFPGAGYIEAAALIQTRIMGRDRFALYDIDFSRGLILQEETARELRLELGNNDRDLIVRSRAPGSASVTNHARIGLSSMSVTPPDPINPKEMAKAFGESLCLDEVYDGLHMRGLDYGDAFRTVLSEVKIEAGQVLALFDVPDDMRSSAHAIHPVILDSCFHALMADLRGRTDPHQLYVPRRIRALHFFRPLQSKLVLYCTGLVESADGFTVDFSVYDAAGDAVFLVLGLDIRPIPRSSGNEIDNNARYHFDLTWLSPANAVDSKSDASTVIALLDRNEKGRAVAEAASKGRHLTILRPDERDRLAGLVEAAPGAVVLDFCALDAAPEDGGCDALCLGLSTLQTLSASRFGRCILVTERAQPAAGAHSQLNPEQASLIGAIRVADNELNNHRFGAVDFGDLKSAQELAQTAQAIALSARDLEVTIRGDRLTTPRIVPVDPTASPKKTERRFGDAATRLALLSDGDALAWHWRDDEPQPPQPGEVALAIDALVLPPARSAQARQNKADAAGGQVVAGRIVATGTETDTSFNLGDRLVGIVPDGLASDLVLPATQIERSMVRLPAHVSTEYAVAAVLPFTAALYALETVARPEPDETVLIAGLDADNDLAAVQIARASGARVFALHASVDGRARLRLAGCDGVFDSATSDFRESLLAETDGRGVDIVLSNGKGELAELCAGLLAPLGRLVQFGGLAISVFGASPTREHAGSLSVTTFNPRTLWQERPTLFKRLLKDVLNRLEDAQIKPIKPITLQADTLETEQPDHDPERNRLVLTLDPDATIEAIAKPKSTTSDFGGDGACLITGGLTGLGLATARWLARNGVRSLVLVSRRGPDAPGTAEIKVELEQIGVQVHVFACDVGKRDQVEALFSRLDAQSISLSGVFHAAGVLEDAIIENQTPDMLRRVFGAKSIAAWNLHRATQDHPVKWFVLYSSISSFIGTPGQLGYVGANAVMDSLAHYRRNLGLPALSVNWGVIGDVGMAANTGDSLQWVEQAIFTPLSPDIALDSLHVAFALDKVQMSVADANWGLWANASSRTASSRKFETFEAEPMETEKAAQAMLAGLPAAERFDCLQRLLIEALSHVLSLSPEKISPQRPMNEFGLDSLMVTELQIEFSKLGIQLSLMELMQSENMRQLTHTALNVMKFDHASAA